MEGEGRGRYVPQFSELDGSSGVKIDDPVEGAQFTLYTDAPVAVRAADVSAVPWCFPIDSAVRLDRAEITTPIRLNVNVRTPDGTLVAAASGNDSVIVPEDGDHVIEFGSTPIKLYLAADSSVVVETNPQSTTVRFPEADGIHLGARTLHEQPARTLTTTRKPADLMQVISEFGGALKTTSCERSFPTLRGHPPLIEFGDEVSIPGGQRRPETGIRIVVPPVAEYVFPTASLAYYLGAEVVSGDHPRIVTDDGFSYDLTGEDGFAATVNRLLHHVFTLDCVTRTEGFYPVTLHERRELEAKGVPLDWTTLYDEPLKAQLRAYLEVPFETVAEVAPQWRLTADIVPDRANATVLPHLAAELAAIRNHHPTREQAGTPQGAVNGPKVREAVDAFVRTEETSREQFTRSEAVRTTPPDEQPVSREDVFRLPEAESATQTYIGDGFPLNANKGSAASYERQLELRARESSAISVTVVCNDAEMLEELAVGDYYGARDIFTFNVDLCEDLSRAELRAVFESNTDLVHYIGHVDQRGLQASDGYLSVETIETVETTAFILNGCRSFRQGQALVDAGAIGGIVTLEDVHNGLATAVGTNIARLLNQGWPLDGALKLVKDDAIVGRHYVVVGDGSVELVTSGTGTPIYAIVDPQPLATFNTTMYTYPNRSYHLGSLFTPYIGDEETRYIGSGEIDTFELSRSELEAFLSHSAVPVQTASNWGETTISMQWSGDIDIEEL